MKIAVITLFAYIAFIIPKIGNGQNSRVIGELNVAKYISVVVGKSVYDQHFKLNRSPNEPYYSLLPLDKHFDYYYDIVNNDFVIEQLKFFTDTLGNIYTDEGKEWIGWRNKLRGYKMYFNSKFKYSIEEAKRLVSDSLRSKNIHFELLCDCTFKKGINHLFSFDLFKYDAVKDLKIEFCYEFKDGRFDYYSYGKFYGVIGETSRLTNKRILFDPSSGKTITSYHLDSTVN